MTMLGVNPSIQMVILVSSFQYEENNYMVVEALEVYSLASAEEAYEDPEQHVPIVIMASGGEFYDENDSHWADQKEP